MDFAGVLAQATGEAEGLEEIPWWVALLVAAFAAGTWYFLFRQVRRGFRLTDLPVSKTQGAFIGTVRFEGAPEPEQALRAPFVGEPCVWYRGEVQRQEQRTTTQRDAKTGRTSTSTQTTWRTVWRSSAEVPFHLRDDTGTVWVLPEGAHVNGSKRSGDYRNVPDPSATPRIGTRGALGALLGTSGGGRSRFYGRRGRELRWSVEWLPVGATTTVIGPVRWTQEGPLAFVASKRGAEKVGLGEPRSMGPDKSPFEMILGDETAARRRNRWPTLVAGVLAVAVTVLASILAGAALADWEAATGAVVGGVAVVVIALVALVVGGVNRSIRVVNRAKAGSAEIDVQLQRRGDLLRQASQVVSGYASFEAETLEALTARRGATDDPSGAAQAEGAQAALRQQVAVVAEAHPELRADQSFLSLQETITDCENRLALARTYYNSAARALADLCGQMPWGLFARLGGVRPLPLLEFSDLRYLPPPSLAEHLRAHAAHDATADDPTADDEGRVIESTGEEDEPDDEGADSDEPEA